MVVCKDCMYWQVSDMTDKFGKCLRKRSGTPGSVKHKDDASCKKFIDRPNKMAIHGESR